MMLAFLELIQHLVLVVVLRLFSLSKEISYPHQLLEHRRSQS